MSVLWDWSWDPGVVAALAVSAFLYALGIRRLSGARRVRGWQIASFAAAWLTLVAALLSPLHELSEVLFSAHMAQHELLMIVAAPLWILGRPGVVFLAALPSGWRHGLARLPHRLHVEGAWHVIASPAVAWALYGAALWVWHLPALYQAALADDGVHAVQHLCFFGTGLLFWRALVYGRHGRLSYGVAVLYVFTTTLHSSLLGVLFTVSPRAWYPAYAATARWGLTPLEDQQLAGVLMWVPAGVLLTGLGLALFAAWIRESERRVAYTRSERLSRLPVTRAEQAPPLRLQGGAREA